MIQKLAVQVCRMHSLRTICSCGIGKSHRHGPDLSIRAEALHLSGQVPMDRKLGEIGVKGYGLFS